MFRKRPNVTSEEVHQYRQDLEGITALRDRTTNPEERKRYTTSIEIMQLVLLKLLQSQKEVYHGRSADLGK